MPTAKPTTLKTPHDGRLLRLEITPLPAERRVRWRLLPARARKPVVEAEGFAYRGPDDVRVQVTTPGVDGATYGLALVGALRSAVEALGGTPAARPNPTPKQAPAVVESKPVSEDVIRRWLGAWGG